MKNACVVGYGAIGSVHAQVLFESDAVTLYGICDIDQARVDKGVEKYGCKGFRELKECLADANVDSVHICTPHYLHYEMIVQCIEAGKMVVIEKPVVMKPEEFAELLSDYGDKPIYPVMQNRENTCVKVMKEIIASELKKGKLIAVKGILTWHRDAQYYADAHWRGTKAYEGGGVLINQAIHTLDLMIYLAGKVTDVTASISNKSLQGVIEVEDTVDAYMKLANGATGIFYATNAYGSNSKPQLELEFKHTSLRYMDGKLFRDGELVCCDDAAYNGKNYWGSGHAQLFYDLYSKGKAFSIADVKNTMQTLFAIYDSAKTGTTRRISG